MYDRQDDVFRDEAIVAEFSQHWNGIGLSEAARLDRRRVDGDGR